MIDYPGVSVSEVASAISPISSGVGLSTGAFVGMAERGPVNEATLITSLQQYYNTFGGYAIQTTGTPIKLDLAYAVRQFFANGGSRCYIVRVTDTTTAATALVSPTWNRFRQGFTTPIVFAQSYSQLHCFDATAISPGLWGNKLRISTRKLITSTIAAYTPTALSAAPYPSYITSDIRNGTQKIFLNDITGVKVGDFIILTADQAFAGNSVTFERGDLLLVDVVREIHPVPGPGEPGPAISVPAYLAPSASAAIPNAVINSGLPLVGSPAVRSIPSGVRAEFVGNHIWDGILAEDVPHELKTLGGNTKYFIRAEYIRVKNPEGLRPGMMCGLVSAYGDRLPRFVKEVIGDKVYLISPPTQPFGSEPPGYNGGSPDYDVFDPFFDYDSNEFGFGVAPTVANQTAGLLSLVSLEFDLFVYLGNQIAETHKQLALYPTDARFFEKLLSGTANQSNLIELKRAASGSTLNGTLWAPTFWAVIDQGQNTQWNVAPGSAHAIISPDGFFFNNSNGHLAGFDTGPGIFSGGADGSQPAAADIVGTTAGTSLTKSGLDFLRDKSEVRMVSTPGYSDATTLRALAQFCSEQKKVMGIGGLPNTTSVDQAVADAKALQLNTSYMALYWPWVRVTDQFTPSITTTSDVSGIVQGLAAKRWSLNGPHFPPAGEQLRDILDGLFPVSDKDLATLQTAGINSFKRFPNRGLVLFGARTQSTDAAFKFLNVRALTIYIEQSLSNVLADAVFDPINTDMQYALEQTISAFMQSIWAKGWLYPANDASKAFSVEVPTQDSTSDLQSGILRVNVAFSPPPPAEQVKLAVSIGLGGISVTEG